MPAKTKKPTKNSKKFSLNPATFERNLMIVLLVLFLVSAVLLFVRNADKNIESSVGEPIQAIERTE